VLKNDFWGITGGFRVSVFFSIMAASSSSQGWVEDVYRHFPETKNKLSNFPQMQINLVDKTKTPWHNLVDSLPGHLLTGLDRLPAYFAFALRGFAQWKGVLAMCTLQAYHGLGICQYCQMNSQNKECQFHLPRVLQCAQNLTMHSNDTLELYKNMKASNIDSYRSAGGVRTSGQNPDIDAMCCKETATATVLATAQYDPMCKIPEYHYEHLPAVLLANSPFPLERLKYAPGSAPDGSVEVPTGPVPTVPDSPM